jgi:hypothetical protein
LGLRNALNKRAFGYQSIVRIGRYDIGKNKLFAWIVATQIKAILAAAGHI